MDYQDPGRPEARRVGAGADARRRAHDAAARDARTTAAGRTAVLATGGTWRWQMSLPLGDNSHDLFWQQLLRWLVTDTRGRVVGLGSQSHSLR